MTKAGQRSVEALLKSPFPIDQQIIGKIESKLNDLTGKTVNLNFKVDPAIEGAVIYLGQSTQIEINLNENYKDLERHLEDIIFHEELKEKQKTHLAQETVDKYDLKSFAQVKEHNLRTALRGLKKASVTLVTKVPLEKKYIDAFQKKLASAAQREIEVKVKEDPRLEAAATLYIGDEKKVELDVSKRFIDDLETEISKYILEGTETTLEQAGDYLVNIITKKHPTIQLEEITDKGTVIQVGDGVALVTGLKDVGAQEMVRFQNDIYGIAFNLLWGNVGCILLGPEEKIEEGSEVSRTGHILQVPVGKGMAGRIVNALGQPIDEKGPIDINKYRPLEKLAPGIIERQPVKEPLHTGIKMIDALVPLGRGQRELILGDRKIGKTTIAIDTILSQKDSDVVCIYAAIGQKASTVARVVKILEERKALDYTIVVVTLSNEEPAFRYITPYTACTIGEDIMESGGHALVIYDDLTKHAVTYREMSALLKRPIGREAYPGDIFYLHSRLLERSARLRDDLGGGSLTSVPIAETQVGDIAAFIPTNLISICDGQIFLETSLFNEGYKPAMEAGLSVSRVGGMAQTPAMKKVAGKLRMDLAQYDEMAQFVKFGAEVDQATMEQLTRGERGKQLLKQAQHVPLPLEKEIVCLYAVINGYLDEIPLESVEAFEQAFFKFMEDKFEHVLKDIDETKDLTEYTEGELKKAILNFKDQFLKQLPKK